MSNIQGHLKYNNRHYNGDPTVSRSYNGSDTVTVTATQSAYVKGLTGNIDPTSETVPAHITAIDTRLKLASWSIKSHTEGVYLVEYQWSTETTQADASKEVEDTSESEEPTDYDIHTSTRTVAKTVSILAHPALRNKNGTSKISLRDAVFFALYLSGSLVECANGSYRLTRDPAEVAGYLAPPTASKVWGYILAGVKQIQVVEIQYIRKYSTKTPSRKLLDAVGTIRSFSGAPTEDGNGYKINHLLNAVNVSRTGLNLYSVEENYVQSQAGGWDAELYAQKKQ